MDIDQLHKWRSKKYCFVFMLIRPTSLVLKEHFFCILSMSTRLVSLITALSINLSIKRKIIIFFGPPFMQSVYKILDSCGNSLFSSLPKLIALVLVILVSKNILKGRKLDLTYLYACWIMWMRYHWQMSKQNAKGDWQNL